MVRPPSALRLIPWTIPGGYTPDSFCRQEFFANYRQWGNNEEQPQSDMERGSTRNEENGPVSDVPPGQGFISVLSQGSASLHPGLSSCVRSGNLTRSETGLRGSRGLFSRQMLRCAQRDSWIGEAPSERVIADTPVPGVFGSKDEPTQKAPA